MINLFWFVIIFLFYDRVKEKYGDLRLYTESVTVDLGSRIADERFKLFQTIIRKLSRGDDDDLHDYYNLLKNIKWVNTTFNENATEETLTGESSIDIIIDKFGDKNERRLVLIQCVKKIHAWNVIIAIMVVGRDLRTQLF